MMPTEIACGWVTGGGGPVPRLPHTGGRPVQALEEAIRPALLRTPCVVEFSGGRDSSLVLAVAHRLAQREGLPPPIAFTNRYPGFPEANEDEWQESVIDFLGVADWERHDARESADLLGPAASASLRTWGVVWPPLAHTHTAELEVARGGSLLSGEGGDEVFGPRRATPLRLLMSRERPPSPARAKQVAFSVAPNALRARLLRRRFSRPDQFPWLTPPARAEFAKRLALDAASEPLGWRTAVRRHPEVGAIRRALSTLRTLGAAADVERSYPLLDAAFLNALARAGGRLGFPSRTAAMRSLFTGLLPDPLLARDSKCRFNRAVFGRHSRSFVERWDGGGVDPDLVDAVALRSEWVRPEPHAMTYQLLQSCWLTLEGGHA